MGIGQGYYTPIETVFNPQITQFKRIEQEKNVCVVNRMDRQAQMEKMAASSKRV